MPALFDAHKRFRRRPPTSSKSIGTGQEDAQDGKSTARDIAWSIFMTRAQTGDADAYRCLLAEITPYLRTLSARYHRDPNAVEGALQDILLSVHTFRHTYDPSRPFLPWLAAVADHCLTNRLRRQNRFGSRQSRFTARSEIFPAGQTVSDGEALDRRDLLEAANGPHAGQCDVATQFNLKKNDRS